jgi:aminoglycoside 2''-phosphotransferase
MRRRPHHRIRSPRGPTSSGEPPGLGRFESLIRLSLPDHRPRRITWIPQGSYNWTFDVDHRFIFRFPRSASAAELLAAECRFLPRLAPQLPLAVPDPIVIGALPGREPWPFMGYVRIPGRQLDWSLLGRDRFRTLVRDLAPLFEALADFPRSEATSAGILDGGRDGGRRYVEALYREVRERAGPLIPERLRAPLERAVRGYLDDPRNLRYRPTLVHGEIHSSHVLWGRDRVQGLIDWGFTSIGDPALEFGPWAAHFGTRGVHRLMAGRVGPGDSTFLDRVKFYRLIVPLRRIRNRARDGDLEGAREAVGWLRRALTLPPTQGWSR